MIRTSRQHHGPTFAGRRPIVWRALSLRRARSSPAARPSPRLRARHPRASQRDGFTLIELLVVISIILLVAAMTLATVNLTFSGDRIRGAARQVQSYLEGARSRAVYGGNASGKGAGYQCGVRFIRDANNPNLCASIQFVEIDPSNAALSRGLITLARKDDNSDNMADSPDVVRLIGTANTANVPEAAKTYWYNSYRNGLIFDNQVVVLGNRDYRIIIPKNPPNSTTIDPLKFGQDYEELWLSTPYAGTVVNSFPAVTAAPPGSSPSSNIKILLPPQPMANQEPRLLGNGVVFDLSLSKGLNYFLNYNRPIDVMFSPRGMVVGPVAGSGIVEFVIGDREDSLRHAPIGSTLWQPNTNYAPYQAVVPSTGRNGFIYQVTSMSSIPGMSGGTEPSWTTTEGATFSDNNLTWTCYKSSDNNTNAKRERLVVSLTPLTGKTAVHPVYVSPGPPAPLNQQQGDPFRYAETGEVARQ